MASKPLEAGTGSLECDSAENNETGLAIKTTPNSEMYAAICSILVNGSLMKYEHAQQASDGERNVMTVASARGRYIRESMRVSTVSSR